MTDTTEPKTEPKTVLVSRDEMLAKSIKRRYTMAVLPDWLAERTGYPIGSAFRLQSLTESERTECELYAYDDDGEFQMERRKLGKAKWIVASQVNAESLREWSDEQIDTVSSLDSGLVSWLVDQVHAHCAVTEADIEALKKD
mgnify:CR=1 FL=1